MGISFIDAASLKVCHKLRIPQHRTFRGTAARDKSSTGWYYGFKITTTIGILPKAEYANQIWTYDFVFDQSLSGKSLKMLTLIDEYTRECLAVKVGVSITSEKVRSILQRVCLEKDFPKMLRSDNGSEFIGQAVNI